MFHRFIITGAHSAYRFTSFEIMYKTIDDFVPTLVLATVRRLALSRPALPTRKALH